MDDCTETEIKNLFIFNSSFCATEGEEYKKVLYYYPADEDINTQTNTVGLVEAIIKFTGNFKPTSPVKSLHTQKKRQLYFQPEEDYWMVMTLNLPHVVKTKDGVKTIEYEHQEDVLDNVYEAVLKQAYLRYRLQNGTYSKYGNEVAMLKQKMNDFYTAYVKNLKLVDCDILTVFSGIHYLPLDKANFLNVQCFVNSLQVNFPLIGHVSFMFKDSLIWSDLEPENMQVVYHYLLDKILPNDQDTEAPKSTMFSSIKCGCFFTSPIGNVLKVFLNSLQYHLIVYTASNCIVSLFIPEKNELVIELFKQLAEFMEPELAKIASGISDYCSVSQSPSDSSPKFIYFNKFNLACKTTQVKSGKETMQIITDMNNTKSHLGHSGETIVKSMNDYWIVGKVSNQREFYVALQQKNASLIDISGMVFGEMSGLKDNAGFVLDEVKRVCDAELKGIFFHPM